MSIHMVVLFIILAAVLATGIALIIIQYGRDIRAAHQRLNRLGSQVIETNCGPIEYVQTGQGYPMLVIHGAMGGFDQGLWLARSFGITDYQVIAVSRFGYLRTPVPSSANLDLQADAFASLLDALAIRRVGVLGVSAGTTSAIRFAARYPERISAMVLVGPDAPGELPNPFPPRFIFDKLLRSDFFYWLIVTFFGKWTQNAIGLVPNGYVLTPEQAAQIAQIQKGDLPVSQRIDGYIFETYTVADDFTASVTPQSPYPLDQIATPVLVINALDDLISIPENVHKLVDPMPNARLFNVPEGGHFLFGHTGEVQKEIVEFLRTYLDEQPTAPVLEAL